MSRARACRRNRRVGKGGTATREHSKLPNERCGTFAAAASLSRTTAGIVASLRQPLADPDEPRRHRPLVPPLALAIAVGEIVGQRGRMGIDDDLGAAEGTRRLLRELEKNGAVALPLQVAADADEAKARLRGVDEVDAHGADDLAVAQEHMRETAGLEFVRVALVVGLSRQQGRKNRIPADCMIGGPLLPRMRAPQDIAIDGIRHLALT